jgi:hypothetical protein
MTRAIWSGLILLLVDFIVGCDRPGGLAGSRRLSRPQVALAAVWAGRDHWRMTINLRPLLRYCSPRSRRAD